MDPGRLMADREQILEWQYNEGFSIHPARGKKPIHAAFQDRVYSLEELLAHDADFGILAGGPEGLGAVDLDTTEARRLGPKILPPTLTIHKGNEIPSLYLYKASNMGFLTIRGVDGGEVVSAKFSNDGKAHRIVCPPSVHPSKGPYTYTGGFNPAAIAVTTEAILERKVRLLGATSIIAANIPEEGGRHDYALAVAGFLLKNGQSGYVREMLVAAWEVRGLLDRRIDRELGDIVESTLDRMNAGEPFKGGGVLKDFHDKLPRTLARSLGLDTLDMTGGTDRAGRDASGKPSQGLLRDLFIHKNPHVGFSGGDWYMYLEGVWGKRPPEVIGGMVDDVVDEVAVLTNSLSKSVFDLVKRRTYIPEENWDSNENIIPVANGTLEIDTMTLREFRPEDWARSRLPFDFDPDQTAPNWEERVGGRLDPAVWEFLQEFVGYSLTTRTEQEIAVWLVGERGGGKSTFIEGVELILGQRQGTLSLADVERSAFALSNIPGKTLLTATEQPASYISQADLLNAIISGEGIMIDRKYRDPIEHKSTAKILWAMNDKPRIAEQSSGLWRRIRIVDWPDPPSEPDTSLKGAIRGAEGPGILNWALDGLSRVLERGSILTPEIVRDATEEFKLESDVEARFLDDECELGTGEEFEVSSRVLYSTYQTWASDHGFKAKSDQNVAKDWRRLGLEYKRNRHGRFWAGVKLRTRTSPSGPGGF